MPLEYLKPIPSVCSKPYKPQQLGNYVAQYKIDSEKSLDIQGFDIAIFSVADVLSDNYIKFREEFYQLFIGNWSKKIIDLGAIISSENEADTFYATRELCQHLLKNNVIPILVGGDKNLLVPIYQSFKNLEQFVNIASVSPKFDFGNETEVISTDSYISRIISDQPTHLNNFVNIGYQSYYVSQEELDLMENMLFEAYRLGNFITDITEAEPILRNTDVTTIDMNCIQAKDLNISNGLPNGFSGREICNIARYIGLSSRNKCSGIFNLPESKIGNGLAAQIVWYIIEGLNFRTVEFPTENDSNYMKYSVPIEDYTIEFFKSILTERWWIRPYHKESNKITTAPIIPCSKKEYDQALRGIIPECWWKAYRLL